MSAHSHSVSYSDDDKLDYLYSSEDESHFPAPPSSTGRAPITLHIPPRAAFIAEPNSPGVGSPRSLEFGDSPRSRAGTPLERKKSGMDWNRFSMAAKRKSVVAKGNGEKGIAGLLAWHFVRPRTTTTPQILGLGGLDGQTTTTAGSTSAAVSSTPTSSNSSPTNSSKPTSALASATSNAVAVVAVVDTATSTPTSAAVATSSKAKAMATTAATSSAVSISASHKSTAVEISSAAITKRSVPFGHFHH
ncbi:hypothetical protein P7C70_g7292, partial [Phenoliferia sp. Uapishka_3]